MSGESKKPVNPDIDLAWWDPVGYGNGYFPTPPGSADTQYRSVAIHQTTEEKLRPVRFRQLAQQLLDHFIGSRHGNILRGECWRREE